MSNLLDSLTEKAPNENAGADTASRFDYQKNWAFCHLIDKHAAGEDYLVAFEFHEDVLFLAPEANPTAIDFYQIKTSKSPGTRKLSTLTSKKNGKSIIGKLIANSEIAHGVESVRLILVSNNAYDFSAKDICAAALPESYRTKLVEKLKDEIPGVEVEALDRLHFMVTDIPVDGMDTYLRGKVHELFEKRFGKEFTINLLSWLRLIQGEITRRNNHPSDEIKNVADLVKHKCVGRTFISGTLTDIEKLHTNAPDMNFIKGRLSNEGWTISAIMRFDKATPRAVADYNDPTNEECSKLCAALRVYLDSFDISSMMLSALIEQAYKELSDANAIPAPYRDKSFMAALTVLIYNEKL